MANKIKYTEAWYFNVVDDEVASETKVLSLALCNVDVNDDERLDACGLLKIALIWLVSNDETSVVLRVFKVAAGITLKAAVEIEFNKVGDMLLAKLVALIPAIK